MLSLCVLNVYALAEKSGNHPKELTLATTRWCPYTCFDESKKFGIVGLYIRKIIASHNITLSIAMATH